MSELTKLKPPTPRCCFGMAPSSLTPRCSKPAVWANTWEGKITELVWCDEHKPDLMKPLRRHGLVSIEAKSSNDQALP